MQVIEREDGSKEIGVGLHGGGVEKVVSFTPLEKTSFVNDNASSANVNLESVVDDVAINVSNESPNLEVQTEGISLVSEEPVVTESTEGLQSKEVAPEGLVLDGVEDESVSS